MELTKRNKNMKELIEEAEKLYKEIDSIQMLWVASTKDNDEEGKRLAIGRMSVAMCDTMQLLRCIIDRKDNIVDTGKVFHSTEETPDMRRDLLYESPFGRCGVLNMLPLCDEEWSHFKRVYKIRRWAYIDDLLPKGGEK